MSWFDCNEEYVLRRYVDFMNREHGKHFDWYFCEDVFYITDDDYSMEAIVDDEKLAEIEGTSCSDYFNIEFDWYC